MRLGVYLTKYNIKQQEFAASLGVNPSSVCRWIKGERTPSGAQAKEIVAATKGRVTFEDIFG